MNYQKMFSYRLYDKPQQVYPGVSLHQRIIFSPGDVCDSTAWKDWLAGKLYLSILHDHNGNVVDLSSPKDRKANLIGFLDYHFDHYGDSSFTAGIREFVQFMENNNSYSDIISASRKETANKWILAWCEHKEATIHLFESEMKDGQSKSIIKKIVPFEDFILGNETTKTRLLEVIAPLIVNQKPKQVALILFALKKMNLLTFVKLSPMIRALYRECKYEKGEESFLRGVSNHIGPEFTTKSITESDISVIVNIIEDGLAKTSI